MGIDTWDEIRTAYQVARLGTVSGAAEVLGVHHATVIRHIDALEKRLGTRLFQRHARGYTPTEAGQDLLSVAQMTNEHFAQLASRIKGFGETVAGELVVTSIAGVSELLVPALAWLPAPDTSPVTKSGAPMHDNPPSPLFMRVFMASYFCAGVGFVVSATFIVAIVNRLPGLEGQGSWSFLAIGLAAMPATSPTMPSNSSCCFCGNSALTNSRPPPTSRARAAARAGPSLRPSPTISGRWPASFSRSSRASWVCWRWLSASGPCRQKARTLGTRASSSTPRQG